MAIREELDLHMIQYDDPVTRRQVTTVACPLHRGRLLEVLRALGQGCGATTAPILSRCDECHS